MKVGKDTPESSRLESSEKTSPINFALPHADNNTPGQWNRDRIASLPLLKTILAIRQKSQDLAPGKP